MERSKKDLLRLVFSWPLQDILNDHLFRDRVRQIPKTFSSGSHYLDSFILPLIEETRTELCSSIKMVSKAPTWEITDIELSNDYEPPLDLFYKIEIKIVANTDEDGNIFEPEPGQLIALTDRRPTCIDDLSTPGNSYSIASIKRVRKKENTEDVYEAKILTSKPIELKQYWQKDDTYIYGFGVYLCNMTTFIRIWNALNSDPDGPSIYIIKQLLQPDSGVGENCAQCFSRERHSIDTSKLGAVIRSFDLNEAQEEGVLSCVAARECSHKNTVKLIWGPPGTGKTKTASSILYSLLKRRCKTLTCAPTNVAVLELTSRFIRLVMKSLDYLTYGLGDIVLFGNKKRMRIDDDDDLFDIFLDYRANVLSKCFAPLSGWKHHLELMICLLEDPENQYHEYLNSEVKRDYEIDNDDYLKEEKELLAIANQQTNQEKRDIYSQGPNICKQNEWKKIVNKTLRENRLSFKEGNKSKYDKQEKKDFLSHENRIKRLTFHEFVKKELNSVRTQMRTFAVHMCTHLPTAFISLRMVKRLFECLDWLDLLATVLSNNSITDQGFKLALASSYADECKVSSCTWQYKLCMTRKECLERLKILRDMLILPDFFDEYSIKSFCFKTSRMIFCTASSSSRLHTEGLDRLEMLVIDEAAQLKECESNIPLQLPGLRHVVLIGDEKQLPALIKSEISDKAGFGRSLFERLVLLGHKKHLLNVQYRMHPSISYFPNMQFYDNQLLDSLSVKDRNYEKHFLGADMFKSFSFIDVASGEDEPDEGGNSWRNMVEVAVVLGIILELYKESVSRKQTVSVGVISPYKAQVVAIKDALDKRYCLWIIGNGETLMNSGSIWEVLVVDAIARGCYHSADEDERLSYVIATAMIELGQVGYLLNMNSLLFKKARWKVCFNQSFLISMARIKNTEDCKKICSLLMQLTSGWHQPRQEINIGVVDDTSSQLLGLCKVNELLYLVWTIDVLEENSNYVQVLKIWDVLPISEVSQMVRDINIFCRNYSVDIHKCCKIRCSNGDFVVPMRWSANLNNQTNHNLPQDDPMQTICNQLDLLQLRDV
ncbi:unnamed protein product [Trifolium pratense]|uniref:Uncharacterized protein n=1 Tax=Trifolium pratense TaxID=57577 RepID=A0ACB0J872_TRIPR|nr:unnamed protein product [Trifolium pratense]